MTITSTTVQAPIDLLNLVGQPLGVSSWHEITQDQVNMFAEATGDRQWIHTDPIRAAAGPFGGPIAHGYLTLALAPVVLAEVVEVDNVVAALNYGVNKVRFPAPVPVGGRVRGVVHLACAEQRPAGIEAVFTVVFELDGSDRPACVAEVVAIYR
jgi:acyl dehydratase